MYAIQGQVFLLTHMLGFQVFSAEQIIPSERCEDNEALPIFPSRPIFKSSVPEFEKKISLSRRYITDNYMLWGKWNVK